MPSVHQDIARHKALWDRLGEWSTFWQSLANYVLPRKAHITEFYGTPSTDQTDRLYDNTTQYAVNINANGQMSLISPKHERWFILRPPEELQNNEVAENWYSQVGAIIQEELQNTNFYEAIHEFYIDRAAFGTASLYVQEGERNLYDFWSVEIGTYAISDNFRGRVDTFTREVEYSIAAAAREFGIENLSPKTQQKWAGRAGNPKAYEENITLVCLIEPREDRDPTKDDNLNMPYREVWLEKGENHRISESGYAEMPYMTSRYLRWDKRQGPYGFSPSWTALPDARQLNLITQYTDYLVELKAFPRTLIPGELEGNIDWRAGMPTYYNPTTMGDAEPKIWLDGGDLRGLFELAEGKREAIRKAFMVDYFEMFAQLDKQMTAHEVVARESEKLIQFSPTFARTTTEVFNPLFSRLFGIGMRVGAFPDPPDEVAEYMEDGSAAINEPHVEYTSKVALAVNLRQESTFARKMDLWAPVLEAQPDVLLNVDFHKQFREDWRNSGLEADNLRPDEEVKAMIEARMEQQAQEQQAAQLMEGAKAASGLMEKIPAEDALAAMG